MTQFTKDNLLVYIAENEIEMGQKAASDIAQEIMRLSERQEEIRMMFAAAPSQDSTLKALLSYDLPWNRIVAFHMDEYVGISPDEPQSFRNYLTRTIFGKVRLRAVNLIRGDAGDIETERFRYEKLLRERKMDLIVLGIGENGHIAFNDPPDADFNDDKYVKIIRLSERSRQQQVNDGCFFKIDDVPLMALTVTIPVFREADALFCSVPNRRKADAVKRTLKGSISDECPASILRVHGNARLYLDKGSSCLF